MKLEDPVEQAKESKRQLKKYMTKREQLSSIILIYRTQISEGPTFVCSCCGCLHFRRCVVILKRDDHGFGNQFSQDFLDQVMILLIKI